MRARKDGPRPPLGLGPMDAAVTHRARPSRSPTDAPIPILNGARQFARRHPVLCVLFVALVVRLVAASLLDLLLARSLIMDDTGYTQLAADRVTGADMWWEPTKNIQYWRNSGFLVPLTALFWAFGPISLVGQAFVALMGAIAAALTTRLAMELIEPRWAMFAGLTVALLPSQVFFSSLVLKDALIWAALALAAGALATAGRRRGWQVALWLAPCAASIFVLTTLRAHTAILAAWALGLAAWFGLRSQVRFRAPAALLLAIALPWIGGLGPAGIGFLTSLNSVAGYRQAQATGNLPIVTPTTQPGPTTNPPPEVSGFDSSPAGPGDSPATEGPKSPGGGGSLNGSSPTTTATAAPVLEEPSVAADEGWYPTEPPAPGEKRKPSVGAELSHLPTGLAVMLIEPHPFRRAHNTQVWLAKAEMLFWYPLLALALVGLVSIVKAGPRAFRAAAFPILVGGGSIFVAALAEGNFGTAFRHRGEFVWVVALLAAVGLRHLWLWRRGVDAPPGVTNVVS